MNNKKIIAVILSLLVFIILLSSSLFTVEEGFQAVVFRFGKITRVETEAGLNFKIPFMDKVDFFPKKIITWDGNPDEILTLEGRKIWLECTAKWRIADPALFYQSLQINPDAQIFSSDGTIDEAQGKLDNIIESTLRTVIARYPISESIRSTDRILNEMQETNQVLEISNGFEDSLSIEIMPVSHGREGLADMVYDIAQPEFERFGIYLVDFVIREIRFSEEMTNSIFLKMIQERNQEAELYRAEGEANRSRILGQMEKDKQFILSQAEAEAQQIRGEADAEAAAIYREAYSQDPDFYRYWRTLESYQQTMPGLNKILTTDMEYFDYLYDRD